MNYVIVNADELDEIDFTYVLERNSATLRYSLDKTKAVLKYEGDQPSFLSGKTEYTHSEILTILATDEWTPPFPPE